MKDSRDFKEAKEVSDTYGNLVLPGSLEIYFYLILGWVLNSSFYMLPDVASASTLFFYSESGPGSRVLIIDLPLAASAECA